MRTIIHVNQQVIARNRKTGSSDPPLIARNYRGSTPAHQIDIKDANGSVIARIVNSPHKPLRCGARVWIETCAEVETVAYPSHFRKELPDMCSPPSEALPKGHP